jgi:hypothetical protein
MWDVTKRAQKGQATRSVSFRMPLDLYNDLTAVAEMRGVDLSGMLNWICAEYRPTLLKKKAEYEASMLEAAAANLRESMASAGNTDKALGILRDLLRQLQDMYAAMAKRALDEDERRAG